MKTSDARQRYVREAVSPPSIMSAYALTTDENVCSKQCTVILKIMVNCGAHECAGASPKWIAYVDYVFSFFFFL